MFVACLVQTIFGFGSALIAMPLIAMLIPFGETVPIISLISCILSVLILIPIVKEIQLKSVGMLIAGSAVGIPIGAYAFKLILLQSNEIKLMSENIFGLILGLMIIMFSIYQLKKPKLIEIKSNILAVPTGIIAGTLGGLFNTNGPPVVIYGVLKRWDPNQFRASLQAYFVISSYYIAANHYLQGVWSANVIRTAAYSIPSVILAVIAGFYLGKKIPAEKFSYIIYIVLIIVGLIYCGKSAAYLLQN